MALFMGLAGRRGTLASAMAVRSQTLGTRSFASREPLLPKHIVKNPRVKAMLPALGNISYGGLASGFLLQDVLALRAAVATAYCGIASFHALQERPLRIPFAWSVLFACINIYFAVTLGKERFCWLDEEEQRIYQEHFSTAMTQPDFQQLIRTGSIATASERVDVIDKGQADGPLVLVVSGTAEVTVGEDVVVSVQRPGLLGESSYLRSSVATKTVTVLPGCRYVVWDRAELKSLHDRKPSIQRSLELIIGRELSRKLGETSNRLIKTTGDTKYIAIQQKHVEYEAVVLRYMLSALSRENLLGTSDCSDYFETLAKYRREEDVPDQVHSRVMENFSIEDDVCIRKKMPLCEMALLMSGASVPHARVKVQTSA